MVSGDGLLIALFWPESALLDPFHVEDLTGGHDHEASAPQSRPREVVLYRDVTSFSCKGLFTGSGQAHQRDFCSETELSEAYIHI
jgi:hypothetical protein